MLRVTDLTWRCGDFEDDEFEDMAMDFSPDGMSAEEVLRKNPKLIVDISAPLFFWLDDDHQQVIYTDPNIKFPEVPREFCFDAWADETIIEYVQNAIHQLQLADVLEGADVERRMFQLMPMGAVFNGKIIIEYSEIVRMVKSYLNGDYSGDYLSREMSDLCETFLDIYGIRENCEV